LSARGQQRRFVLDANALISLVEDRAAAPRVRQLIQESSRTAVPLLLSAVNWGEVIYVIWRRHGEARAGAIESQLRQLPMAVIPADQDRAGRAAAIKQKHNLGYADSFAAELALDRGASLVTADPEFERLGKVLTVLALPRHER